MKVKTVPAAPERVDAVVDARGAVPLVPKPEMDCCARLADRLGLDARDEARTWLTFLRGLGLVDRTEQGFARTRDDVDEDALVEGFLDGVFGAREVFAALESSEEPLAVEAVFERFESNVPEWERHKHPGVWRDTWRERVARLLDWLVLLGLVERRDGRFALA